MPPRALARMRLLTVLVALSSILWIATPASRWHANELRAVPWLLVVVTPIVAWLARRAVRPARPLHWLQFAALLDAALVLVGALVNLAALSGLPAGQLVAIAGMPVQGAREALLDGLLLHLFLPSALFSLAVFAELRPAAAWRWSRHLPLLLVPSALVALAQRFAAIDLWNIEHFARLQRASGISYDANSLAGCAFLLLPFALTGALLADSRRRRFAAVAAALLLGVALVLSGNRAALAAAAGWLVASPWLALAITRPAVRWRRLALAVAPPLLAVLTLSSLRAPGGLDQRQELGGIARVADAVDVLHGQGSGALLDASGRADLWRQARRMWADSPLAGIGPGGYGRELSNYRFRFADSAGYQPIDLATSHYLQIAAELGGLGLLVNLVLLVAPLAVAWIAWRRTEDRRRRAELATLSSTLLIALPLLQFNHFGLFPDFVWTLASLLALLATTAAPVASQDTARPIGRRLLAVALVAAFAIAATAYAFGPLGFAARRQAVWWPFQYDAGCYPTESWHGVPTRWCAPDAWLAVPVASPGDRAVALRVYAAHPDLPAQPLLLRVSTPDGAAREITFERSEWRQMVLPATPGALRPCLAANRRRATCLVVHLEAARGWRPSQQGDTRDDRLLGVAVQSRALPDLSRRPGYLFADDFEGGDLLQWRYGEE